MYYEAWKEVLNNINDYINSNRDLRHQDIIDKITEELAETHLETYLRWKSEGFDLDYLFSFQGKHVSNQYTLLYIAAYYGFKNIVEALLAGGAEVDAVDSIYGVTPLHFAAKNGYVEIVRILLQNDAEVDAVDNIHGATPLHFAAQNGHIELVEILLRNGAEVNARDKKYEAVPLHIAAGNGHAGVVSTLLENGASVNARDKKYGAIPLHVAAGNGYTDAVKVLLDGCASVHATDKSIATPLHWAAKNGHTAVVSALLEKGADVDALDKYGATPLHWAAKNSHIVVVGTLLENGANAFLKTKNDQSPRDLTSNYGIRRLFDRLGTRAHSMLVIVGCAAIFFITALMLTMWYSEFTFIAKFIYSAMVVAMAAAFALVIGIKCIKLQPNTQVDEVDTAVVHYNPHNSEILMI